MIKKELIHYFPLIWRSSQIEQVNRVFTSGYTNHFVSDLCCLRKKTCCLVKKYGCKNVKVVSYADSAKTLEMIRFVVNDVPIYTTQATMSVFDDMDDLYYARTSLGKLINNRNIVGVQNYDYGVSYPVNSPYENDLNGLLTQQAGEAIALGEVQQILMANPDTLMFCCIYIPLQFTKNVFVSDEFLREELLHLSGSRYMFITEDTTNTSNVRVYNESDQLIREYKATNYAVSAAGLVLDRKIRPGYANLFEVWAQSAKNAIEF